MMMLADIRQKLMATFPPMPSHCSVDRSDKEWERRAKKIGIPPASSLITTHLGWQSKPGRYLEHFLSNITPPYDMKWGYARNETFIHIIAQQIGASVEEVTLACEAPYYTGHIYFVRRLDGSVKIGSTLSLKFRLSGLRHYYHGPLLLEHAISSNLTIVLEHALHQRFVASHVSTEWFKLSREDLDEIRMVNDVQFKADIVAQRPWLKRIPCFCYKKPGHRDTSVVRFHWDRDEALKKTNATRT